MSMLKIREPKTSPQQWGDHSDERGLITIPKRDHCLQSSVAVTVFKNEIAGELVILLSETRPVGHPDHLSDPTSLHRLTEFFEVCARGLHLVH